MLLPGHPETWWAYRRIMPDLARRFRVIAVDIRGMGSSDKPFGGYDKKTMADDVCQLIRQLGYEKIDIAGHDIRCHGPRSASPRTIPSRPKSWRSSMSPIPTSPGTSSRCFPRRESSATRSMPITRPIRGGSRSIKFAALTSSFSSVTECESILLGCSAICWKTTPRSSRSTLRVYGDAYSSPDGIRAGHGWYQAWPRDIEDQKLYPKLTLPVLGLGAEFTGV